MNLETAMRVASTGMKVQSARLRVVAENLANAESTARTPGGEPYRRKTIEVTGRRDRSSGATLVEIRRYGTDRSELPLRYLPGHPAADAAGYVRFPNVNPLIELVDMREAQRSYEANLNAMQMARGMIQRTLDILR
ncbi:MAG: flagellar basal body rod protein FlgC [Geminicoccaceae bacterium]|nr:flagellar basal body rod protein FlgC [Geminicoccaceae bacterium]MCX8100467.1 flagellar basal body rod protein FlgC [Geminicoccaceae bacterium]MDW8370487.1 flagellar basal body rod protein FlgC [Geminicoccaceae bacterium]